MSDNIRISKLQPDRNSARELLVAREAGSGETLSRKVRKVATVMDLLWSSFRRGWSTKIPNTKSQRGIQTPAALWLLCNVGFLVDSTKFWKVAISPVIKTFIRKINLKTDGNCWELVYLASFIDVNFKLTNLYCHGYWIDFYTSFSQDRINSENSRGYWNKFQWT